MKVGFSSLASAFGSPSRTPDGRDGSLPTGNAAEAVEGLGASGGMTRGASTAPVADAPARVPGQRFYALDGMRGIAAMAVVLYHAGLSFDLPRLLVVHGSIAVDFFFCLSGFVLSFAHQDQLFRGGSEKVRFAQSRFLRLWPVIFAGTVLSLIAAILSGRPLSAELAIDCLLSLVCLPRILDGHPVWLNGVYWSLFAENLVNALWAALGRSLTTQRLAIGLVILAAALIAAGARAQSLHFGYQDYGAIVPTTLRAAVSFSAGLLMYRIYRSGRVNVRVHPLVLIAALVFPMLVPGGAPWFRLSLYVLYIIALNPAIVLLGALCGAQRSRALVWLGEISFPLYAVHGPVVSLVALYVANHGAPFSLPWRIGFAFVAIAGSIATAMLASRLIEKPVRTGLRRLTASAH